MVVVHNGRIVNDEEHESLVQGECVGGELEHLQVKDNIGGKAELVEVDKIRTSWGLILNVEWELFDLQDVLEINA